MKLLTEQEYQEIEKKVAVFDWLCKKTMVSIRKYDTPDMHFEYFIGVIAKEKTRVPTEQALYNAFLKDTGNE